MATYRKRGTRWRVEICVHGTRCSKSFATKAECQRWATIQEYEMLHGMVHPSSRKTLRDALQRYLEDVVLKKNNPKRECLFLENFMKLDLADRLLEQLKTDDFVQWRDKRLEEVAASTVNRELTVLHSVYRCAVEEWGWVQDSPLKKLKRPPNPEHRDRRVWPDEERMILEAFQFTELRTPKLTRDYVVLAWLFALETAMRSGEILNLTWKNVHFKERYVHVPKSKTGIKRDVALSKRAIEILSVLPRNHETCFKIDAGQRDAHFRKYVQRSGVVNMTFHDSRHEALTRLAQKLPILDLARTAGIRNPQTLMIYYNATATEIADKLD